MATIEIKQYWKASKMLKKFVVTLFFSLITLTVSADNADVNIKDKSFVIALNQVDSKSSLTTLKADNDEIITNLNGEKAQNNTAKSQQNNGEETGWLLALALFGFVMLSNRRGV